MMNISERTRGHICAAVKRDYDRAIIEIDDYLERLYRRGRKQTTIDNYRYVLTNMVGFLADCGLHSSPDSIGEYEISAIIHDYPGVSDLTKKDYITKLSKWMMTQSGNRTVEHMGLLWPRSERPGRIWADRRDALKIMVNESITNRLIIVLAMELGLRACEISSLRITDIEGDWLKIYGKGHGNGKMREMAILPDVRKVMDEYLEHRTGLDPDKREERMLLSDKGSPISPHAVSKRVIDMSKRNGVRMTAHSLRRTFITDMLDSGVNLATVSKIAGHDNPAVTAGYYRCRKEKVEDAMGCRHQHVECDDKSRNDINDSMAIGVRKCESNRKNGSCLIEVPSRKESEQGYGIKLNISSLAVNSC